MSGHLWDRHRALLTARGITDQVIADRGYESTAGGDLLLAEGFSRPVAALGAGLLIPVWDVHGKRRYSLFRPDQPRGNSKGKPVKYETPRGARVAVDVPPRAATKIDDPKYPLYVTESVMKADALVSAGLVAVGLGGVYGWRGTNHKGGKTALTCWEYIALSGRDAYLVPDSDMAHNPMVNTAVRRLGGMLGGRGATVLYVTLPSLDGGKTGVDDYLAKMGPADGRAGLLELADDEPPPRPEKAGKAHEPAAAPPDPLPPPPADPAAMLDQVHAWLAAYVAFPSEHAAAAVTLWAAHTHLYEHFESTPRLALLSPEKQCGKSRVLELLALVCAQAETLSDASPAYLYRRIGAGPLTILLDEADAIWKRGKGADEKAEALRSVINAGHRKGATVGRVEMNSHGAMLTRFPVYAPAAVAAIGTLPATIIDRAVVIRMRRRAPGEVVRDYRERITGPEGGELRGQLAAWAGQAGPRMGETWPAMPEGVTDRAADVWEPLLMVADAAGGRWPGLARDACAALVTGAGEDGETAGVKLLSDLRGVWPTSPTSPTSLASNVGDVGHVGHMATAALLELLHGLDESPWGDWYGHPLNPRDLARLLRPYGIRPHAVRIGKATPQGYSRADFTDAWERYLPPPKLPDDQPLF